jgi:hypothetical protein
MIGSPHVPGEPERRFTDTRLYVWKLRLWIGIFIWLTLMTAFGIWFAVSEHHLRQTERVTARYLFCIQDERLKQALRADLHDKIEEAEAIITGGGFDTPFKEQMSRQLQRDLRMRALLKEIPGGCVAFARDPTSAGIIVPEEVKRR